MTDRDTTTRTRARASGAEGHPAVGWDRGADRASNDADVSSIPPIIPYSGFSPVRLEGWPFRRGLPNTSANLSLLPACAGRCLVCRAPRHLSNGTALSPACGLDCAPPLGGVSTTPGALARVRVVVSRSVIT